MLTSFLTLFLLAISLLGYEILLMRLLSVLNFSHYAYMVASLAMLGVAFSGTLLALFPTFFKQRRNEVIFFGSFLSSLAIPLAFHVSQKVPVNYLYLLWDGRQMLYLGITYALYGMPFLVLSTVLALFFLQYPERAGAVYAVNLLGSGCGVLGSLGVMFLIPPEKYLFAISMPALLAGLIWGVRSASTLKKCATLLLTIVSIVVHVGFSPNNMIDNASEYKGLPSLLRLPDTKIVYRSYSPLGLLHILKGKSIRLTPGLSIKSQEELPSQLALTVECRRTVTSYRFKARRLRVNLFQRSCSIHRISSHPRSKHLDRGCRRGHGRANRALLRMPIHHRFRNQSTRDTSNKRGIRVLLSPQISRRSGQASYGGGSRVLRENRPKI